MFQLIGSLVAPVAGALLYGWLHNRPRTVGLVDGFMYGAVPALVAWQVIPHAWADHGMWVIAVVGLGAASPAIIERISHQIAPHTDNLALLAGFSGLLLHAFLEGASLVSEELHLGTAVFLHRIPVGMMIWWLLRPRHGFGLASIGLAAFLLTTISGFAIGARFFESDPGGMELYQAFVGGSLVHVVFHQSRHDHSH